MSRQCEGGKIEMADHDIRAALDRHWAASDANDFEAEHQIYQEDAVLEYPQSGERIRGRRNIQASRFAQPSKSASQCGGYSALPTSGSLNSLSPTMRGRLTGEHHGVQRREGSPRDPILR